MTQVQSAMATTISLMLWVVPLLALGVVELWTIWDGVPTISDRVWKAPLWGAPIVLWGAIGPVFLALHFWFGVFKPAP